MTKGGEDVALGSFSYNTPCYAVIVMDDDAIRTAWIWDIPEDEKPDEGNLNSDINVVFDPMTRTLVITVTGNKEVSFSDKRDAVKAEAAKELGVKASDITVSVGKDGDWTITDKTTGDEYVCTTTDVTTPVVSGDKDSFIYTEVNASEDEFLQAWVDLAKSNFLTYDFTVTANTKDAGSKNITVHVSEPKILSPNTKNVPGFTGEDQTLDEVYGQSGVHKDATKYAIIALYSEETGTAHYKLVSDAAQPTPDKNPNTSLFGQDGEWNVNWDINW